MITDD